MNTAGDDMAEYFRLFVEETGEQLDTLVEIMLRLEAAPDDRNHLAEAFRMIHSIKGSSALLGLEQITSLSHMLESHFDRLRSGKHRLDAEGMDCTLACIDFLRICNDDIRDGCETDLSTSKANCGECELACAGNCEAAVCQTDG